ncbi:LYR motif-containing protein 2 isoform X1 [Neovison vison]|uniref:LYR motif-containing protein 2 isoform X1 n=1 Tax=Neovison vison TaxID=452646 RepID=UPI001CF062A9|nr:LYR motif-containing protein 2 isoform X1 [Neogale vison]
MATSRLPPATLTLKQFMRRQQVLLLYRRILQAIREVPNDSDRKYLKDWTREEFKRNKSATEENRSKKVISESDQHLKNVGEILQNGKWLHSTGLHTRGRERQKEAFIHDLPALPDSTHPAHKLSPQDKIILNVLEPGYLIQNA